MQSAVAPDRGGLAAGRPLAPGGELMWLIDQLSPAPGRWISCAAAWLPDTADPRDVASRLQAAAGRAAVPAAVALVEGRPVTAGGTGGAVDVEITEVGRIDWRAVRAQAGLPFCLDRGPLVRARLYRGAAPGQLLLVTASAIAADARGLCRLAAGTPVPRRDGARAPAGESGLAGADLTLRWPGAVSRPARWSAERVSRRVLLDAVTSARLAELARAHGTSAATVVCAALRVLLQRHTGQRDILIALRAGTGAGQPLDDLLVLRQALGADESFSEVLAREAAARRAAEAGGPGFAELAAELAPVWEPGTFPLAQIVVAEERAGGWSRPGWVAGRDSAAGDSMPFDVEAAVGWAGGRGRLTWSLHPDLPVGAALTERFGILLAHALAEPGRLPRFRHSPPATGG